MQTRKSLGTGADHKYTYINLENDLWPCVTGVFKDISLYIHNVCPFACGAHLFKTNDQPHACRIFNVPELCWTPWKSSPFSAHPNLTPIVGRIVCIKLIVYWSGLYIFYIYIPTYSIWVGYATRIYMCVCVWKGNKNPHKYVTRKNKTI